VRTLRLVPALFASLMTIDVRGDVTHLGGLVQLELNMCMKSSAITDGMTAKHMYHNQGAMAGQNARPRVRFVWIFLVLFA